MRIQLTQTRDNCSQIQEQLSQCWLSCSRFCISCTFHKRPHIPPVPLSTGVPVWGTYSEIPHIFPIHSPLMCLLSKNKLILRDPKWGTYGEPMGNLIQGSPPLKPFIHRHSMRFVGKCPCDSENLARRNKTKRRFEWSVSILISSNNTYSGMYLGFNVRVNVLMVFQLEASFDV